MKKSIILSALILALVLGSACTIKNDGSLKDQEKNNNGVEEQMPNTDSEEKGLSEADKSQVEGYIRGNISELSPEEAVLGGSFHVSSMEFISPKALIVNYEDGHIALSARAEFDISEDGQVNINSFEVEEENEPRSANFSKIGNIVAKGENWELVYEEPGKPALRARLQFNEDSKCTDNENGKCFPPYWQNGDRAQIKGSKKGDEITVKSLSIVGEAKKQISSETPKEVNSFNECVDAGYELMYPDCEGCQPYCETPDGQRFTKIKDEGNSLCVDNCGNGICEEMVCMGEGCPCAETVESCPQDCK